MFASSQYPELFGYAGDVLFPSTVLSQLIEMMDAGILFTPQITCQKIHAIVYQKLCYSFSKYPTECANKVIQILHISTVSSSPFKRACISLNRSFSHGLLLMFSIFTSISLLNLCLNYELIYDSKVIQISLKTILSGEAGVQ